MPFSKRQLLSDYILSLNSHFRPPLAYTIMVLKEMTAVCKGHYSAFINPMQVRKFIAHSNPKEYEILALRQGLNLPFQHNFW